jgi:hypothetical protein
MVSEKKNIYTCNDYRQERTLLALKLRLSNSHLSEQEKQNLLSEIRKIEHTMGMD